MTAHRTIDEAVEAYRVGGVLERAEACLSLKDEHGLPQARIAHMLRCSRPHIANLLRVLELPEFAREAVRDGRIRFGHARVLVSLPTDDARREMLDRIVTEGLSVHRTEEEAAGSPNLPLRVTHQGRTINVARKPPVQRVLARLSAAEAEVRELRAHIATLRHEIGRLDRDLESERISASLARIAASLGCETPPEGCECPGCSLSAEVYGTLSGSEESCER